MIKETWISDNACAVRNGLYHNIISEYVTTKKDFKFDNEQNAVKCIFKELKEYLKDSKNLETVKEGEEEKLICLGIAFLMLFIQDEWTGPKFSDDIVLGLSELSTQEIIALLAKGSDLNPVAHPILLLMALKTFELSIHMFPTSTWSKLWLVRGLFIHQLVLDEPSSTIQDEIETTMMELESVNGELDFTALQLESARMRLYYGYIDKAARHLKQSADQLGLQFSFSGALGKRTQYQEFDVAQLTVNIELSGVKDKDTALPSAAPKQVPLQDDVRMEKIKFTDPNQVNDPNLSPQQTAMLLGTLMYRKKAFPEDELTLEESRTLVAKLVDSNASWPVKLSILLVRSHLERTSRRTVERSMLQVQAVYDDTISDEVGVVDRLKDFFISYLPTKREVQITLAYLFLSLGAVKSALEICLRLHQWELAISCYNVLQLRHKAKELIEVELAKEETPKLLCLLGDATDDVTCYEKAWKLSKETSAKAQRHWANFLYDRKDFKESIGHFEKSLSINSLQNCLWFRLGFAALHEEQWELSAKAYRRYCTLEQDSFEAWNNLARCYCETNQRDRAWRALNEALKIDTSNWRIWDNYMRVSADVKQYNEVIRSYNQILAVKKGNHVDMQVLIVVFKALLSRDDGNPALRNALINLLKSVLERPSKEEAELWALLGEVYALDASTDNLHKDCLIKSHSKIVTQPGWETNAVTRDRAVDVLESLMSYAEQDPSFRTLFSLYAKPSIGTILRYSPEYENCNRLKATLAKWDLH